MRLGFERQIVAHPLLQLLPLGLPSVARRPAAASVRCRASRRLSATSRVLAASSQSVIAARLMSPSIVSACRMTIVAVPLHQRTNFGLIGVAERRRRWVTGRCIFARLQVTRRGALPLSPATSPSAIALSHTWLSRHMLDCTTMGTPGRTSAPIRFGLRTDLYRGGPVIVRSSFCSPPVTSTIWPFPAAVSGT